MAAYPGLERDSSSFDANAVVFSPDGSVLYATASASSEIVATKSDRSETPTWTHSLPDTFLCDIAISPDGVSVRTSAQTMDNE